MVLMTMMVITWILPLNELCYCRPHCLWVSLTSLMLFLRVHQVPLKSRQEQLENVLPQGQLSVLTPISEALFWKLFFFFTVLDFGT